MPKSMTGTPRASTRCAGCGHARQRHQDTGRGACADVCWGLGPVAEGCTGYLPHPCTCSIFTEPEGS